jgi:hypothetical protein
MRARILLPAFLLSLALGNAQTTAPEQPEDAKIGGVVEGLSAAPAEARDVDRAI